MSTETKKRRYKKIRRLPNTELDPKTLLHQILEDIDDIDGVVVVELGKNCKFEVCWSHMTTAQTCMASMTLVNQINKRLYEE